MFYSWIFFNFKCNNSKIVLNTSNIEDILFTMHPLYITVKLLPVTSIVQTLTRQTAGENSVNHS